MSISLSELIAEIGNENCNLQFLTRELHGNQKLVGKGGKVMQVSFLTDPNNVDLGALALNRPLKREALIVWVDREKMDAAMARLKARKGL